MLTIIQSLALGAVQGLTEFLPISSSGHLILARELLGINTESGLAFDAVLQLGSILAVFIYFRQDIVRLIRAFFSLFIPHPPATSPQSHSDRQLLFAILIGTIPALVLGLLLEETMETTFRSPLLVALTLALGSLMFYLAEKFARQASKAPNLKQAWWIGVFQCLALVPGVSRSGSTISGGLFLGLDRVAATRFGFLLSLPIITGAGLFKLIKIAKYGAADFDLLGLAVGFIAAFGVGYLCIAWLIGYLKNHSLMVFVWYRLALSAIVLSALSLGI
jgi:undecaprenyl-diphosphatase